MSKIIGTCSNCGGPVEVPSAWMCIHPPLPKCRECGARPQNNFGPIIPMTKPVNWKEIAEKENPGWLQAFAQGQEESK